MQVSPENLTNENIQKFQQAQSQLSGSLSRLLVTVEQYPNLRANDAFRGLTAELSGTENRIATARRDFNGAVQDYNVRVRRFPTNIFASIMGFHPRDGFTADPGTQNAPKVDFGGNAPAVKLDSTTR